MTMRAHHTILRPIFVGLLEHGGKFPAWMAVDISTRGFGQCSHHLVGDKRGVQCCEVRRGEGRRRVKVYIVQGCAGVCGIVFARWGQEEKGAGSKKR